MKFGEKTFLPYLLCTACVLGGANTALAAPVAWTDWISATAGFPGSASGTLTLPSGTVNVSYTGEVFFAQTSASGCVGAYCSGNINEYWTPGSAYVSPAVDNGPRPFDIIALLGPAVGVSPIINTITFSAPVTNPVIAINSLGQGGNSVEYHFTQEPWSVLSFNAAPGSAYWGPGTLAVISGDGDIVEGEEGSGTIQFLGPVTSISWFAAEQELWHGVTVGAPVPVPAAVWLLGTALMGLVGISRRRRV